MDGQTPTSVVSGVEDGPVVDSEISGLSKYIQEEPICILVGPEKTRYYVHKGLLAAKSPFFSAMFKDCWDGSKKEVELSQISDRGFSIVVDSMYSGKLSAKLTVWSQDSEVILNNSLHAYKAADILMVSKLQNEIILNEAAYLRKDDLTLTFLRLKSVYDEDLCHTKYYAFALKSAMIYMQRRLNDPLKEWNEQLEYVGDNAQLLADLLKTTRDWLREPWSRFLEGDLAEFLV